MTSLIDITNIKYELLRKSGNVYEPKIKRKQLRNSVLNQKKVTHLELVC
jgi:hypothetical protein